MHFRLAAWLTFVLCTFTLVGEAAPEKPEKPVQQANEALQIGVYVVAGGGGSSSGGAFKLDGTAGQAAAGAHFTAPNLSLTAGFWSSVETTAPAVKKRPGQVTSQ